MPPSDIYTVTATGRRLSLIDPDPAEIDWRAVAAQLARINRFAGAARLPYSVAQHSLLVAHNLPVSLRGYGLAHDVKEMVLGDIPQPAKVAIIRAGGGQALRDIEAALDIAIHAAAGLPWPLSLDGRAIVDEADARALATEWRDLMPGPPPAGFPAPYPNPVKPLRWDKAEEAFLGACDCYLPQRSRP